MSLHQAPDGLSLHSFREHIVPTDAMGHALAHSHVDLGDEGYCIELLIGAGYLSSDVHAGLDAAIELARAIRAQTDTPLTIARDLAAAAFFVASVFGLCIALGAPAHAGDGQTFASNILWSWEFWGAALVFVGCLIALLGPMLRDTRSCPHEEPHGDIPAGDRGIYVGLRDTSGVRDLASRSTPKPRAGGPR